MSSTRTCSTGGSLKSRTRIRHRGIPWSRFFRNQDKLAEMRVSEDLAEAMEGTDAVVLAVRHEPYLALSADEVVAIAGHPVAVVDCFGILDDARIKRYFELGCEVKGLGRGHVKRIKDEVRGGIVVKRT